MLRIIFIAAAALIGAAAENAYQRTAQAGVSERSAAQESFSVTITTGSDVVFALDPSAGALDAVTVSYCGEPMPLVQAVAEFVIDGIASTVA